MKFLKIRDVKSPSRGTSKSAGIDLFIPNDFENRTLNPGDSILIPAGLKANVPDNYAFIAFNKSGVATKQSLSVGACVVDEDYEGEIHLHLINVGRSHTTIKPGQKLTQFILIPVSYMDVHVLEELPDRNTERGAGGFGSTGL
jgi:dUTP pyrophosphatase